MASWYGRIEAYVPLFVAGGVAAVLAWVLALIGQWSHRRYA